MTANTNAASAKRLYSWIPNLTSKINFQYITNEINFDGDASKVFIHMTDDENIKKFEIQPKSDSDNFDKEDRGFFYTCSGVLEKDYETGNINGKYIERYPDDVCEQNNIPEGKKEIVNAKFTISENGFIEIYDVIWSHGSQELCGGYKNRQLGIYNNIKNVLHKDVHHESKEDLSIRVYENRETFKEEILEQIILSLKEFERSIKDSNDVKFMLNKYKKKVHQAEGYTAYLKTYKIILDDEANALKEEGEKLISQVNSIENTLDKSDSIGNKIKLKECKKLKKIGEEKVHQGNKAIERNKRSIDIGKNIVSSASNILKQEEEMQQHREKPFLLVLAMLTLFLPSFIASANLLKSGIYIFSSLYEVISLALVYMFLSTFIGYYYTSRSLVLEVYFLFAHLDKRRFMKMKNEMALGTSKALENIDKLIILGIILTLGLGILAVLKGYIKAFLGSFL